MILDKDLINQIDLSQIANSILELEFQNYFLEDAGREHYKLLGYVSKCIDNETIIDIGTYKGCSALALSLNTTNLVKSFDISNYRSISDSPENVEFILDDITNENYKDLILSSKTIVLDTDHNGIFERKFYSYIKEINWKGVLILDDIHLNDAMKEFWDSILDEKYDITDLGHSTGTGLIKIN